MAGDHLGTTSLVLDANGNMTSRRLSSSDPTYTQTWDYENRLTQATKRGTTAAYVYDGDGNRVKSTVNGATTAYPSVPLTAPEAVLRRTGVGDYFEWTGSASTMKSYYYAGGQRVAMREGSVVYFLLGDHLHSTSLTLNSSGGKVAELRYKAYGETRYTWGVTPTSPASRDGLGSIRHR